ncbi:hypothetical protein [Metaclostridioides mangenotii]|uniref:hypothetical protein n=1 Tax=Metaclostridioides mangenotii TaxID=1540 RepID=UPI0004654CB1|nr:hypothetical protein [Clostridioides mangenotii]
MKKYQEKIEVLQCLGNWKSIFIANRYFMIDIFIDRHGKLYYCVSEVLNNKHYPYNLEDYGNYKNPREAMREIEKIVEQTIRAVKIIEDDIKNKEVAKKLAKLGE